MTSAPGAELSPGETRYLLRALRGRRRAHRGEGVDRVTAGLGLLVIGGFPVQLVINLARSGEFGMIGTAGPWMLAGCGVALAGLCLLALQAFGPLTTGRAVDTVLLAAPLDRRTLLTGRLIGLSGVMLLLGALTAAAASAVGGAASVGPVLWSGAAGGSAGLLLAAAAVLLQRSGPGWIGQGVTAAGLTGVVGALVFGGGLAGLAGFATTMAVALAVAALVGLGAAWWATGSLTRPQLAAGAGLATAGMASALFLDLSLLGGVVTQRRALRIGRVRYRPLPTGRRAVLLAADLRRWYRFRGGLAASLVLLVPPYVARAILPAGGVYVTATLAGAGVASLAAGGLRAVTRSGDLRRLLGGTDRQLRLAQLPVPTIVVACWTALVLPAFPVRAMVVAVVTPVVAVAFCYVQATVRQPDFVASTFDFGFGPIPLAAVGALFRGVAVLAVGIALQLALG